MSGEFWFVDRDNIERGPVTKGDIINMIEAGAIGSEIHMWADPMPDWRRAGQISDFSSFFVPGRLTPRPPRRQSQEVVQRTERQERVQHMKEAINDGKHRFLCRKCNTIILDGDSVDYTGGEFTGSFSVTSGALPGSYSATANRTAVRAKQRPCPQCGEPSPRDLTVLTIAGTLTFLIDALAAGFLFDAHFFSCKTCLTPPALVQFLGDGFAVIIGGIIAGGIVVNLIGELYLKPMQTRAVVALLEEQSRKGA
jgi:hypothetical protein